MAHGTDLHLAYYIARTCELTILARAVLGIVTLKQTAGPNEHAPLKCKTKWNRSIMALKVLFIYF